MSLCGHQTEKRPAKKKCFLFVRGSLDAVTLLLGLEKIPGTKAKLLRRK
jgi:hypothetical protein